MERIFFAGSTFTTGTDIAVAVMEYARLLAERNQCALITFPIVSEPHSAGTATLLLGPQSPHRVSDVSEPVSEIIDERLVVHLKGLVTFRPSAQAGARDWMPSSQLEIL